MNRTASYRNFAYLFTRILNTQPYISMTATQERELTYNPFANIDPEKLAESIGKVFPDGIKPLSRETMFFYSNYLGRTIRSKKSFISRKFVTKRKRAKVLGDTYVFAGKGIRITKKQANYLFENAENAYFLKRLNALK